MKRKLLLAALCVVGALGFKAWAQDDVTSTYLKNADLTTDVTAADNGWTCSWRQDFQKATDATHVNVVEFYSGWGGLEKTEFKISQSVTLPAGDYRIAVNAFYRNGDPGDGTNNNMAYIFAGENKQNVIALTSGALNSYSGSSDLWKASNAFYTGAFSNAFDFSLSEETTLDVGFQGTFSVARAWVILGPVKLYKYSLEDYLVDYRAKVAEAEALYESPMNADVLAALQAAVVEESSFSLSSEVTAAIATLTTQIAAANTSIANYVAVKAKLDAASSLDAAGKASYAANETVADVQAAYDERSIVSLSSDQSSAMDAAIIAAAKAQITEGADMTLALVNPSFELGNITGWTNSGTESAGAQGNKSFDNVQGNYYAERWHAAGTIDLNQTVTGLPAGVYRLSAYVYSDTGDAALYANSNTTKFSTSGLYSVDLATDGDIKFGATCTLTASTWICMDGFTLTYVGALPNVTAVEGKMNADVASAQATAVSDYNSAKSVAGYNAALAAIAAAEASVAAYAKLTTAVTKIDAALEAATTATASTDDYDAIKTAYTNGTIADNDIQTNIIAAYNAVIPVIKSQTAASADFTLAIENPSFEFGMNGWTATSSDDTGVRELSNATYAAEGADGDYIFNTWSQGVPVTQVISDLPDGQYTMTASIATDEDKKVYLLANGEHNEGITATDKGHTVVGTITFLVKDGTATIGAVGGDNDGNYVDAGGYWYKVDNFRLVKNRDLTAEEEAVAPTAIALKNGETVVSEPIALDATTNTVTLTPSYTPTEATEGYITWTSSDVTVAAVANGVVTAVSSGSATITATSTLDGSVSGSATVTVSYPESKVPSFVNAGATRTVYHYGANLIKNGSFEYPDAFTGWTSGTGAKLTPANFSIQTSDAYDGTNYLKASLDKGQGDAGSIYTSWPVEAGKKYIFSYQMKNSSAVSNDGYIRTSLSATTSEDENSYNETFKAVSCGTAWTTLSYTFTVPEGKNYLVFSARWLKSSKSFDNFYLCEVLSDPTTEGNVDYATAAIPTANIGTGAFQYSQDAIDAANALVQGTATVAEVESAYNALKTLNAPADGKLYNIVNITSGFAHNGKALTFKSASDADLTENTTSMAWEAVPGSYLPQGVKFTAVNGVLNGYKLSYTRADGNVVYISTGKLSGFGDNDNQIRPTTDASKALTFEVTSAGDNHWYLKNTAAGNNVGSNGDTGFYTAGGSNKDVRIQEAVNNEVSLNILAENQYGTLILPFNAEVPEGVTAYSVASVDDVTLTLNEESSFSANTPYIVYAEKGVSTTLAGIGAAYTDATYTSGLLTGTYTQIAAPDDSYILQNHDGKVAFYLVDTNYAQPNVLANRAYLTLPSGAKARALYFDTDATGIATVSALTSGEVEAIYTAGGVKVESLQKGLNILKLKNGETKKVFVK